MRIQDVSTTVQKFVLSNVVLKFRFSLSLRVTKSCLATLHRKINTVWFLKTGQRVLKKQFEQGSKNSFLFYVVLKLRVQSSLRAIKCLPHFFIIVATKPQPIITKWPRLYNWVKNPEHFRKLDFSKARGAEVDMSFECLLYLFNK